MAVYFIQSGPGGPVKIGKATDPNTRLCDLQTAHWAELALVRVIDGDRAVERWLHRHYAARHLRGEWFAFSECMLTIEPPAIVAAPVGALDRAVETAGGQTALAVKLGVKQGHIWAWLNKRPNGVPAEYVLPIERVTGIPRHELRPDLYPVASPEAA